MKKICCAGAVMALCAAPLAGCSAQAVDPVEGITQALWLTDNSLEGERARAMATCIYERAWSSFSDDAHTIFSHTVRASDVNDLSDDDLQLMLNTGLDCYANLEEAGENDEA